MRFLASEVRHSLVALASESDFMTLVSCSYELFAAVLVVTLRLFFSFLVWKMVREESWDGALG